MTGEVPTNQNGVSLFLLQVSKRTKGASKFKDGNERYSDKSVLRVPPRPSLPDGETSREEEAEFAESR